MKVFVDLFRPGCNVSVASQRTKGWRSSRGCRVGFFCVGWQKLSAIYVRSGTRDDEAGIAPQELTSREAVELRISTLWLSGIT